MRSIIFASIIAAANAAGHSARKQDVSCPLVFDGRVPKSATGATFDNDGLPYDSAFVLGANVTWTDTLRFPRRESSLFHNSSSKAVEVTISDRSIFTHSP